MSKNTCKIYIFTGKGGVGKTSVAAAHGLKSAREGKKTLIISTDMAHNLCDIFETPIGHAIVSLEENLDACEVDPEYVMEHEFHDMLVSLENMLPKTANIPDDPMSTMGMIPGTEELFSLLKIREVYQS